jgi:sRNA-binding protein
MYWHKDQRDAGIKHLAEKYPKCFSENPSMRRPLKKNIIDDLDREKTLDHEALVQVLDWYCGHFIYRRGLIAGAKRIDLNGKEVGTVTPAEQEEARAWIAARKREQAEVATARAEQQAKERQLIKGNNPMISKAATAAVTAAPTLHPSLGELQAAIDIVNGFLTEAQYETMRPALTTTALRSLIGKAEELIESLEDDPYARLAIELRGNGASPTKKSSTKAAPVKPSVKLGHF